MEIIALTLEIIQFILIVYGAINILSSKKDIEELNERLHLAEAQIKGLMEQLRKLKGSIKYLKDNYEI